MQKRISATEFCRFFFNCVELGIVLALTLTCTGLRVKIKWFGRNERLTLKSMYTSDLQDRRIPNKVDDEHVRTQILRTRTAVQGNYFFWYSTTIMHIYCKTVVYACAQFPWISTRSEFTIKISENTFVVYVQNRVSICPVLRDHA